MMLSLSSRRLQLQYNLLLFLLSLQTISVSVFHSVNELHFWMKLACLFYKDLWVIKILDRVFIQSGASIQLASSWLALNKTCEVSYKSHSRERPPSDALSRLLLLLRVETLLISCNLSSWEREILSINIRHCRSLLGKSESETRTILTISDHSMIYQLVSIFYA